MAGDEEGTSNLTSVKASSPWPLLSPLIYKNQVRMNDDESKKEDYFLLKYFQNRLFLSFFDHK